MEAINLLKKGNKNIDKELECIFTFSKGENKEIDFLIKKYNLDSVIKLIGKISYEEVLKYYKSSDLMIFPSYIETLGLPLLEAKLFNLNIIASNLPYAREVVGDYSNIEYFEYNNYKELENKINKSWRMQ